jgi:hypothetical protein
MVVDRNIVAAYDARQFIPFERLAVDIDRRVIGLENLCPNRGQLIVAINENGFHEDRSGKRTATP